MARFMVPVFAPLADPPAPDPADQTDFQSFAAANLPDVEGSLDSAGNSLVAAGGDIDAAAGALELMGSDLAAAAEQLQSFAVEEDADTFQLELDAAARQDVALANVDRALADTAAQAPSANARAAMLVLQNPDTAVPAPLQGQVLAAPPPPVDLSAASAGATAGGAPTGSSLSLGTP